MATASDRLREAAFVGDAAGVTAALEEGADARAPDSAVRSDVSRLCFRRNIAGGLSVGWGLRGVKRVCGG